MSSRKEAMRTVSPIPLSQRQLTRKEALDVRDAINQVFLGTDGYLTGSTREMFKILDTKDDAERNAKLVKFVFKHYIIRSPVTVH